MRFHLERQIKVIIKGDNAGVIDKGRTQPRRVHRFGGGANILFEQAVNCGLLLDRAVRCLPGKVNLGAEGLVDTVLGRGLGDVSNSISVGVLQLLVKIPNRPHLRVIQ